MKSAIAEERSGKNPARSTDNSMKTPKRTQESPGDNIIIINIHAKSPTLVNSVPCLYHNIHPREHFLYKLLTINLCVKSFSI